MNAPGIGKLRRHVLATATALVMASAILAPRTASAQNMIRDAEIEDTLRVYSAPVLGAAGVEPNDVHLFIIQDPTLNAGVSGGQNIMVHTGLIIAAENPNEIIGVLAHEAGHIAGGHLARSSEAMEQAMRPALISIGLGILALAAGAGQAGAALISGSGQFAQANFVRHTQVQESSADQAAAEYLEATGQSGRGLIDFFNHNLRQFEFQVRRMPPYMMSHPYTSDRVEALRQRVSSQTHFEAVDSEDNLLRFRFMQAKLISFTQTRGQTLSRYPPTDTSQPARYARAVAYYRASDLPAARQEMDILLTESPSNPYFQELMGQILFENGRAAESIQYHRRSVELAPNQPLLLTNLARALTAGAGRAGAEEAVQLLQQAVRIEPDNAFAWRELAAAREELGDRALAELASAEQNFAVGNYPAALSFAERSRRELPQNTPSFQRATDITLFAGEEVRRQMERQGRNPQGTGRRS